MRVAIVDALADPKYTSAVDFQAVAASLSAEGEVVIWAKLSYHWREVLSADLRAYVRDGGFDKKTGAEAGALTTAHRQGFWDAVIKPYDKADWKAIEQEHGMSTTKLKHHFRVVMCKEVKKACGK
ncbi:hypothetical protein Q5752_004533 [Cryptotrichosporon argae]